MKPPEILGLLEEAAGTKMYESKKQAALRTLEKKQIKLDEITKVRGRLGRAEHPRRPVLANCRSLCLASEQPKGDGALLRTQC